LAEANGNKERTKFIAVSFMGRIKEKQKLWALAKICELQQFDLRYLFALRVIYDKFIP
jgi:hypothetical protein